MTDAVLGLASWIWLIVSTAYLLEAADRRIWPSAGNWLSAVFCTVVIPIALVGLGIVAVPEVQP